MEKIGELFTLCKASVSITYNEHKDCYESVDQFLYERERLRIDELNTDIRKVMVEKDRMVIVQAYQDTPIGFYVVYHWDLDSAVDEMLSILKASK